MGEFATPFATMHVIRFRRGVMYPKVPCTAFSSFVGNGFKTAILLWDLGGTTTSPLTSSLNGARQ